MCNFYCEIGQPLLLRADDDIARQPGREICGKCLIGLGPIADRQIAQNLGRLSFDQAMKEVLDFPGESRNGFEIVIARAG